MKVTAGLTRTGKIEACLAITATIDEWREIEKKLSQENNWHNTPATFATLVRTMIARVEQQLTELEPSDD